MLTLSPKWNTFNQDAEQLVGQVLPLLDRRKKSLKDEDANKEAITAILSYRDGPFIVKLGELPANSKVTYRDVVEALTGQVLLRTKGQNVFELRPEFKTPSAKFITKPVEATTPRALPNVSTNYGTVYRDGSHSEVQFNKIALLGYVKPSLLTIEAPHHHWDIFFGDTTPPSKNWNLLTEGSHWHPRHEEIMDHVVCRAALRGIQAVRYDEGSFLTSNPDSLAMLIDSELVRLSGRSGQKPLLTITDTYGRSHKRWGGKL